MPDSAAPPRTAPPFEEPAAYQGAETAQAAAAGDQLPEPAVSDAIRALWNDLRALLHDQVQLAALETRAAGRSLVAMIAFGVVVGILVASTWLGLVAALVVWMIGAGLGAIAALLIAVGINLLGAFGFVLAIRRRSHQLTYPATRRSLQPQTALPVTPEPG